MRKISFKRLVETINPINNLFLNINLKICNMVVEQYDEDTM